MKLVTVVTLLLGLVMFTLGCVYVNPSYTPFCATNIKAQGSGSNRFAIGDFSGLKEAQEQADTGAKSYSDNLRNCTLSLEMELYQIHARI